jgi:8-hydroxy-5-deazaflavin:NADPH oxidoreductase
LAGSVGFIGGTGPEGKGLAARFAHARLQVFIGSRGQERGEEAAREVSELAGQRVRGGTNSEASRNSETIVITVPYDAMAETLEGLRDEIGEKLVVCAVVPLQFSRARIAVREVADGSAAQEAQRILPHARVVGAFHNLSASHLRDLEHPIDGDVIVCSDHIDALAEVIGLVETIEGCRGINGGPLANNRYVEDLTALLLNINRIHKAETHVRIVGV